MPTLDKVIVLMFICGQQARGWKFDRIEDIGGPEDYGSRRPFPAIWVVWRAVTIGALHALVGVHHLVVAMSLRVVKGEGLGRSCAVVRLNPSKVD